ncbi:MAG: aminotransferase class I/II-fold pyridoxal phosphate-dependent enzyme, partial [Lachnospiraceae bacterium]|nr:aminotransferase class I/II-fold pyridoxal phosphate-dependent enzyme [Lachnospiraceae bacterium]
MISKKMEGLVNNNSVIRQMFEEGKRMAEEFGAENVYDFSLGNPNVPAPAKVAATIEKLLKEEDPVVLHGYMANAGYPDVRAKIADSLNKRFGTAFSADNIMMTVGAAGGLNCALKALLNPGDEVLTFAPYFVEYKNYVANYDGVLIEVA